MLSSTNLRKKNFIYFPDIRAMNVWIFSSTVFLFLLELCSCSRRIAEGRDASIEEFPFIVQILRKQIRSAGSIVNARYIVTSASSIYAQNTSEMSVIAGTDDVNGTGGVVYSVENILIHPSYKPGDSIFDTVALIRLDRNIVFAHNLRAISLSCDAGTCVGCPTTIVGWERKPEIKSSKMQAVQVKFVSTDQCVSTWPIPANMSDRFICTSKEDGKGVCCGDVGAPVVAADHLMGIVSFSTSSETAEHLPDVHIRISFYRNWIYNHAKP